MKVVLIVDEHKDFADSLGMLVETAGHNAVIVHHPEEALRLLQEIKVDVLVTELEFSEQLCGLDFINQIRGLVDAQTIPIIVCSTRAHGSTWYKSYKIATYVHLKPINHRLFLRQITSIA